MSKLDLKSSIKAVGFDLDGTLYRSNPELNMWFSKRLVKTVAEKLGKHEDDIVEEYTSRLKEYGSTTFTLNSYGLDGEQVFQDLFDKAPLENYVLPDGKLSNLLNKLNEKYKLFIISNGTKHQIIRKLKFLEIDKDLFDPLVACYDHDGWVKPNLGAYLYALDKLGFKPEEVLFVGDREETDIEGAIGVGMKTAMVWGESEKADVSFNTVYDLRDVLL